MPKIAYVNGSYVPHDEAFVSINDRGFQFGDGVYEVIAVYKGHYLDLDQHLDRLEYSLKEMRIQQPVSRQCIKLIFKELQRRNRIQSGYVYIQLTRGVAPRNHLFPKGTFPSIVATMTRFGFPFFQGKLLASKVKSAPDIRWKRPDIKSTNLLGNILWKQYAKDHGCIESWLVNDQGYVTEGCSSNAWIVTQSGELITHPENYAILSGVTRLRVIELARQANLNVTERPFTIEEAYQANEAFITNSTLIINAVTMIDEKTIGSGEVGPITQELATLMRNYIPIAD